MDRLPRGGRCSCLYDHFHVGSVGWIKRGASDPFSFTSTAEIERCHVHTRPDKGDYLLALLTYNGTFSVRASQKGGCVIASLTVTMEANAEGRCH